MSHLRSAIRDYASDLLRENILNAHVFSSRLRALQSEHLPALLVYTRSEAAEKFNEAPRELKRTLELLIEIKVDGLYDCDEVVDMFAGQVEDLIHRDDSLGGLVDDVLLSDTEIEFFNEGAKPMCVARLTFDVQYFTFTNTGIEIHDFKAVEVAVDINKDSAPEIKAHIFY